MVTQQRRIKLFLIIFILVLFSTQANAASFDCKKASTWLEKTVCANPELSKLDEEMAKSYHDALASLSPEGQKETKEYQKQWLKQISYIKAKNDKFDSEHKEYPASYHDKRITRDLEEAYKERIEQLQESLIKFPDRIFRNVYINHTQVDKNCTYLLVNKILTYPQIENPRDENEKFWNNLISKKATDKFKTDKIADCENNDDGYNVRFSNKHLISCRSANYHIDQGAAHGYWDFDSFNWLLEAKRALQVSDLFNNKTNWQNKLAALVTKKLKKNREEYFGNTDYEINSPTIRDIVISSKRWDISKDGLNIQFYQDELGSPAPPLVKIDWKTLAPYMSKNGHSLIFD